MDLDSIIMECEMMMEECISTLDKRLLNIRAGRANPNMLDGVSVEYYGAKTPLKQLANISVPEARQLVVKPFDKGILSDIEKAIFEANLGLTPNNNGEVIFLVIPALTEDRRRELVKQSKEIAEEGKIAIRKARQEANDNIKKEKMPEDLEKSGMDDIQELTNKYVKIVDDKLKIKTDELMTI